MENWIFDNELDWYSEYESNWYSEYESKQNEEFIIFIKEWLKEGLIYGKDFYSDSFIHAAYQEIEEYPFAPCGLNCYIAPWSCLEAFYDSVNSHLSKEEQFNFEQNISIEDYNLYDDVSLCFYFGHWFSNDKHHLCYLTLDDMEKYYDAIDNLLEKYKGRVNCIKKLKIDILQECIDFRQEELNEIEIDSSYGSSLIANSKDWICLEINAIKNKIASIETNAMEMPLYAVDIYIINKLENWIGHLLDSDHRYSTKRFGMQTKLFLKRAFEKDSWQRYLLRKLGVEKSRTYLIAKYYNKRLPFPSIIEND